MTTNERPSPSDEARSLLRALRKRDLWYGRHSHDHQIKAVANDITGRIEDRIVALVERAT